MLAGVKCNVMICFRDNEKDAGYKYIPASFNRINSLYA